MLGLKIIRVSKRGLGLQYTLWKEMAYIYVLISLFGVHFNVLFKEICHFENPYVKLLMIEKCNVFYETDLSIHSRIITNCIFGH